MERMVHCEGHAWDVVLGDYSYTSRLSLVVVHIHGFCFIHKKITLITSIDTILSDG